MSRTCCLLALALASIGAAQVDPLLDKIATYQYGASREALVQFSAQIEKASPAERKNIESRLLRFLDSSATPAGKNFAYRQLSLIGTEASVPALARALGKPETAEIALYALMRIPSAASTDALRQSVTRTQGNLRIGVINTLGKRRDTKAVSVLRPLLASADPAAEAAATALAEIGTPGAADLLRPVRSKFPNAYLHCAVRLAGDGQKQPAVRAFEELLEGAPPDRIRIAALGGLAEADPRATLPALTNALDTGGPIVQAAAMRYLSGIAGPDVTTLLVDRFPKWNPAAQAVLLSILSERGDTSARALFAEASNSPSPEVRLAALSGLGKLGDSAAVPLLAAKAASAEKGEQAAARTALYSLNAPGVDRAVVDRIGAAAGREKVELITAAGERGIASSTETLIRTVADTNPEIHREALRALRNVAGSGHVPALVKLLLESSSASDRREVTQTLASVLKRSDAASAAPVIETYKTISSTPSRLALMEVMGQTSVEEALPLLRNALHDGSPEVVRAAVLALTDWSSPEPLPDLMAAAKARTSPAITVLALRGYLKLMALPSQRTPAASARMLTETMQLAAQPAEKRAVLALLPSFPCPESLQLAQAARNDEAVAKEAKIAADRISGLLKFQ